MSSVILHGIAVFENLCIIPRTKTNVFDGQLFLLSMEPALIGSFGFRYFNANALEFAEVTRTIVSGWGFSGARVDARCKAWGINIFRDRIGSAKGNKQLYLVLGAGLVASGRRQTLTTIPIVYSQTLTPVDYHIMGDVVYCLAIPLGSPENFDLCHQSFVTISGVPTNINRDDATLELNTEQYLSATKASRHSPLDVAFPTCQNSRNINRYRRKGRLERNDNKTVKHFIVDIESVTFLGQLAGSTASKATQGTLARLKSTGFFGSQGSDTTSEEPAPKKRKTADDHALEE
ncbi:hypothetical protein B0H14DRAFT_2634385 [Mycena olivaceomarginata]|nr:hypothetical protein B0H14DRAFT_2634385 [Mycena olivaceomarginata]